MPRLSQHVLFDFSLRLAGLGAEREDGGCQHLAPIVIRVSQLNIRSLSLRSYRRLRQCECHLPPHKQEPGAFGGRRGWEECDHQEHQVLASPYDGNVTKRPLTGGAKSWKCSPL